MTSDEAALTVPGVTTRTEANSKTTIKVNTALFILVAALIIAVYPLIVCGKIGI
jgi:hypothetical protein